MSIGTEQLSSIVSILALLTTIIIAVSNRNQKNVDSEASLKSTITSIDIKIGMCISSIDDFKEQIALQNQRITEIEKQIQFLKAKVEEPIRRLDRLNLEHANIEKLVDPR